MHVAIFFSFFSREDFRVLLHDASGVKNKKIYHNFIKIFERVINEGRK